MPANGDAAAAKNAPICSTTTRKTTKDTLSIYSGLETKGKPRQRLHLSQPSQKAWNPNVGAGAAAAERISLQIDAAAQRIMIAAATEAWGGSRQNNRRRDFGAAAVTAIEWDGTTRPTQISIVEELTAPAH
mmetsp:Transcript_7999/g.19218  ORF Transcript_7999/g.19218 Transcript_7999/m.19218 type:complete len:131 (+) Transcript_7999:796-1188(+)